MKFLKVLGVIGKIIYLVDWFNSILSLAKQRITVESWNTIET